MDRKYDQYFKKIIIGIYLIVQMSVLFFAPARAGQNVKDDGQEDKNEQYWSEVMKIQQGIRHREILQYGMTPIYGMDIVDGRYPIEVVSDSKYFKISQAYLIADNGELTAEITIPSMSYLYVYMGTAKQAAADSDKWIDYREVEEQTVFTIPVEALNKEIKCAAYSKARKKWYDRELVFDASSLPEDSCRIQIPDYDMIADAIKAYGQEDEDYLKQIAKEDEQRNNSRASDEEDPDEWLLTGTPKPVEVDYPDGEYAIEVNMIGGSGRASISSPTWMIVKDGKAYARLLWSSAYYDYLVMGDEIFYNQTTDGGNSVFEIPIVAMDENIPIIADTTAMGDPVEIRYELCFYSMTIGPKGSIPQEAAKTVLITAAGIIVFGGVLNWIRKKKRKV